MLWYKLCFLCLINVQKCLIFGLVYFFGRKLKWGRFCKDLVFCRLPVCMAIVIQEGHPSSVVHLCYLKFDGRQPSNKTPLILRHFSLKKTYWFTAQMYNLVLMRTYVFIYMHYTLSLGTTCAPRYLILVFSHDVKHVSVS